jgi:hypothetical protein
VAPDLVGATSVFDQKHCPSRDRTGWILQKEEENFQTEPLQVSGFFIPFSMLYAVRGDWCKGTGVWKRMWVSSMARRV